MSYAENSDMAHYVTIRPAFTDPGDRRVCFAAGPFTSRRDAETHVDAVRALNLSAYKEAPWLAFGTSRVTVKRGAAKPVGRFNTALGLS